MFSDKDRNELVARFASPDIRNADMLLQPSESEPGSEQETGPGGVAEISAKLARLIDQYSTLDEPDELSELETESRRHKLYKTICSLEEAISREKPGNAWEALSLALICSYRIDCAFASLSNAEDVSDARNHAAAVNRMIKGITAVLEKIAGVSREELGLDWYLSRSDK